MHFSPLQHILEDNVWCQESSSKPLSSWTAFSLAICCCLLQLGPDARDRAPTVNVIRCVDTEFVSPPRPCFT